MDDVPVTPQEFLSKYPRWLVRFIADVAPKFKNITFGGDSRDFNPNDGRKDSPLLMGAQVYASGPIEISNGFKYHYPLIDLDHETALVPSSTEGHFHLVINKPVPEEQYFKLLAALAECGIVEWGFVDATKVRGASHLRLPWIRKGRESQDLMAAQAWWLEVDDDAPDEAF